MKKGIVFWHWRQDDDRVVWLSIDTPEAVNTLSQAALDELLAWLEDVFPTLNAKGLVIFSEKKTGFIAGANIHDFKNLKNVSEVVDYVRKGHAAFDKLASLTVPTVAMIHGFCLGGGLELALACRYRVASDESKTTLGLPEVMLGIQPGWGGTVRLPQRVGVLSAMDLMLSGRSIRSKQAKKIGLVDYAVPQRYLTAAALKCIETQPMNRALPWWVGCLNKRFVRPWIARLLRMKVAKKAQESFYPAPYGMISNWEQCAASGKAAYEAEIISIERLAKSETARNLVRLFCLHERLKSQGKSSKHALSRVHVIGAGTMGGDIAAWCVLQGLTVTLQDQSLEAVAKARGRAYALFCKKRRSKTQAKLLLDRLIADVDGLGVPQADVIIEAVVENLDVKREIFKQLEKTSKSNAVLATNTSSIPLDDIAKEMSQPERLIGIHFFNPVARMLLVEIVRGQLTDEESVEAGLAFTKKINRAPVVVQSRPGFLINRILMPYLIESVQLFEEGVSPECIDQAALDFGMPMGPVTLADAVGLDVCLSVAETLCEAYGGEVPACLKEKVAAGALGVKSGQGFFNYKKGRPVKKRGVKVTSKDLGERIVLRLLNEAIACWDEGIVADQDLLDISMVLGTGFAPFRGGPLQYAMDRGHADLIATMERFAKRYGERFQPHAAWGRFFEANGKKSAITAVKAS